MRAMADAAGAGEPAHPCGFGTDLALRVAPGADAGDGEALADDTDAAPTATQEPTMADNREDRSLTDQGIQDSAEGKLDNLKGKAKDAWGGATGDTSTQLEGKGDQLKGKVKDAFGKTERKLDD